PADQRWTLIIEIRSMFIVSLQWPLPLQGANGHRAGPVRASALQGRAVPPLLEQCWVAPISAVVRAKGLEPPRVTSTDPKSAASTSSATPAFQRDGYSRAGGFVQFEGFSKNSD